MGTRVPHMTAPARFADNELLEVTRIAAAWINAGVWSRLSRKTDDEADCILVWLAVEGEVHFRLERDKTGWTYLLLCRADDWKLIASGSFFECLQLLRGNHNAA
jgi:hypothetical protein